MAHQSRSPKHRAATTKTAVVHKIFAPFLNEPEKTEIRIEEADHLYSEIRIANAVMDAQGQELRLKEGARLHVIFEADSIDVLPRENALPAISAEPIKDGSCPVYKKLQRDVDLVFARLDELARAQRTALMQDRKKEVQRLDQELELQFGKKERTLGALWEHQQEHGCHK